MSNKLILCWKDPVKKTWLAVGQLKYENYYYYFRYTKVAEELANSYFSPLMGMSDFHIEYTSKELFPFFINRILTKSRPEYKEYLIALGFESEIINPMQEMARSSGMRATDSFQLFPYPENKNNNYEMYFFSRGVRHMEDSYVERSKRLNVGDKLKVTIDFQNEHGPNALLLRTADNPPEFIGYCPWFLCPDFKELINHHIDRPHAFLVTVEKVNPKASAQLRLMCKVTCPWPKDFIPYKTQNIELALLSEKANNQCPISKNFSQLISAF